MLVCQMGVEPFEDGCCFFAMLGADGESLAGPLALEGGAEVVIIEVVNLSGILFKDSSEGVEGLQAVLVYVAQH